MSLEQRVMEGCKVTATPLRRIPVVVISPLRATAEATQAQNEQLCYDLCLRLSHTKRLAPWAPHGFYPHFLDDSHPEERKIGIECGLAWLALAGAAVVYFPRGITTGMRDEIEACSQHRIPVFFWDGASTAELLDRIDWVFDKIALNQIRGNK